MSSEPTHNVRRATFHFVDSSQLSLEWNTVMADDTREFAPLIREAASADQFAAEVDGKLVIIQMQNVKYIELTPVPARLPFEWLRGARQIGSGT